MYVFMIVFIYVPFFLRFGGTIRTYMTGIRTSICGFTNTVF